MRQLADLILRIATSGLTELAGLLAARSVISLRAPVVATARARFDASKNCREALQISSLTDRVCTLSVCDSAFGVALAQPMVKIRVNTPELLKREVGGEDGLECGAFHAEEAPYARASNHFHTLRALVVGSYSDCRGDLDRVLASTHARFAATATNRIARFRRGSFRPAAH